MLMARGLRLSVAEASAVTLAVGEHLGWAKPPDVDGIFLRSDGAVEAWPAADTPGGPEDYARLLRRLMSGSVEPRELPEGSRLVLVTALGEVNLASVRTIEALAGSLRLVSTGPTAPLIAQAVARARESSSRARTVQRAAPPARVPPAAAPPAFDSPPILAAPKVPPAGTAPHAVPRTRPGSLPQLRPGVAATVNLADYPLLPRVPLPPVPPVAPGQLPVALRRGQAGRSRRLAAVAGIALLAALAAAVSWIARSGHDDALRSTDAARPPAMLVEPVSPGGAPGDLAPGTSGSTAATPTVDSDTNRARPPDAAPEHAASRPGPKPQDSAGRPAGTHDPAAGSARKGDLPTVGTLRALDVTRARAYSPSFAPDGSSLYFHEEDGTSSRLMRADTTVFRGMGEVATIVDDGARNFHVRLSPDGSRVAFDSDRDGERGVYVASRDGTGVRRVSGAGYAAVPTWSPRGDALVVVRAEPARPRVWNLWRIDLASGAQQRLTAHTHGQAWPGSWFADGVRLCYTHEQRLYLLDTRTGAVRSFASPRRGHLVRTAAASPDGRYIVFQVHRDGMWLLDLEDGSMRRVLDDPTAEEFAWSPDGRQIAFHSRRRGHWGVWIMGEVS
jgi:dipeptidyl aminopeptidase/acylaminoacyl peptidase